MSDPLQVRLYERMDKSHDRWSEFVAEIRRRHVVRVGLAYAGAAFVLLQVAQLLSDAELLSGPAFQVVVVLALAGFPVALLLGWIFDLTPEGVRLTGRAGEGGRIIAHLRPRYLLASGGLVLLGGLAALVFTQRPHAAAAEVAPGADLIAVLPFSTEGEGMRVLEQGMVDLLSRNLNEVGGIRTVDPRMVLSRWEERAGKGALTFEDQVAVAIDAHASSFLTGSVFALGSSVRISADLYSVDGARLAGVRVDGSSHDILGLVDSLSLALLREIWRSSEPIPRLDVRAITSGDLDAIRYFLAGERYYRASAWDSALAAFSRAATEDSLFALAHYRVATTSGWAGAGEAGARSAEVALRLLQRLPAREQTLVRAEALRRGGQRAAAIDTLSLYLEQYPDDPEAWFFLADDLYLLRDEHAALTDRQFENTLWMLDQALAMDPTFTPALIHPLELGFRSGDLESIHRYVELLERAASDSTALGVYRAALAALEQPRDRALLRSALLRSLDAASTGGMNLARQAANSTLDPLLRLAAVLPPAERRELITLLEAQANRQGERGPATSALFHLLVMEGRLSEAEEVLAAAAVQRRANRQALRELALLPVFAGYADTAFLRGQPAVAPEPAARAAAEILAAVDRADAPALRQAARRIDDLGIDDALRRDFLLRVAQGFLRVLEGDAATGLADLEATLRSAGFSGRSVEEAFWFRWLGHAGALPELRGRALAILEQPWPGDPLYEVPRFFALGQALEKEGRMAEAREAYARFTGALAEANGGMPVHARRAEAAAAQERLERAG